MAYAVQELGIAAPQAHMAQHFIDTAEAASFRPDSSADPGAGAFRNQLVNNEKSLAAAQTQKKADALQRMLDPNLIFVAFNGLVFTRQQLISKIQYIDVSQYDMENFKVRQLGPGAALLTYDLRVKASVAGHSLPDKEYASSLWVRHGRDWQLVFHQETPAHHS
ncbi:MAG TPA: nuclear transport factor 2 family protein [Terriglobales bacterium]|nr:nuclear transport factor 2 family protein [Terriglobales bacterium]